ncbi:post-transcriptional regulator [Pseudoneobacillus sp. C159]
MNVNHPYEQFRITVEPALRSKSEELRLLGYGTYQQSQIWEYFVLKKWRKPKTEIHLYEVVDDILTLKPGDFMSFQTIEALKFSQNSLPSAEDWKELLK